MRALLAATIAVATVSVICGCSSAPSAPTPTVASTAGTGAMAPASSTVPLTEDLAALNKAARAQGYVPRNHQGTIVFCRTEPMIGSRLDSTTCISQAQVADVVQRSADNENTLKALQRKSLNGPQGN